MCFVYFVVPFTACCAAQESPEPARVAIFKDDIPPCGAPASPDYLARLLEGPAFSTAFLNSEQLADARPLNRERFDVLVLPYGASFPVKAADNFRKFLRDGGKFFSTGGYAFDNLLERTAAGWQPPSPPPPPAIDHVAWHCAIPAAAVARQRTPDLLRLSESRERHRPRHGLLRRVPARRRRLDPPVD